MFSTQKLSAFLWFNDQAEAAAKFYTSLLPNSRILGEMRVPEGAMAGTPGAVWTVTFELDGREFVALNGGPHFKLNEAFSMVVNCEDQAEVDRYWDALLADGGEPSQCGWLKDKFGLSWQVVPRALHRLMEEGDAAQAARVTAAMMEMVKLDVATLEAAARGEGAAV